MKVGVITFPGTLDDRDAQRAVRLAGHEPVALWHGEHDLHGVDALVLPGGLVRNETGLFVRRDQRLRVERTTTAWTNRFDEGQEIVIPLKNGEGRFVATPEEVKRLEGEGLVAFRYLGENPNGSIDDIAGLANAAGNVVGLMPHPEHAVELGFGPTTTRMKAGLDGLEIFKSALEAVAA